MADQTKIKQHYVPKFYLGNFSIENSNKVWVYDQCNKIYKKREIIKINNNFTTRTIRETQV